MATKKSYHEPTPAECVTSAIMGVRACWAGIPDAAPLREECLRKYWAMVDQWIDIYPFTAFVNKAEKRKGKGVFEVTTFDLVICPVDCKHGSPMGRRAHKSERRKESRHIYDRAVPLTDGYDEGGVYWGLGEPLRVRYSSDLEIVNFYRSASKIQKA